MIFISTGLSDIGTFIDDCDVLTDVDPGLIVVKKVMWITNRMILNRGTNEMSLCFVLFPTSSLNSQESTVFHYQSHRNVRG